MADGIKTLGDLHEIGDLQNIEILDADPDADNPVFDDSGNIMTIEHPDGAITISLNGQPLEKKVDPDKKTGWFDNLAEDIEETELNKIASELIEGIRRDDESRKDWLETRAAGIKLLGLMLEQMGSDTDTVSGISKVRHPLLLEAVLRFQANARAEFLPTDGPAKVRNDSTTNTYWQIDELANALEKDLNYYLTVKAHEYYPDTDRMFLMLGFGGMTFKKVYKCPLRSRPVSETVDAEDLIVSNSATDLRSAHRYTHRIFMKPSTVKRMQIIGAYLDVDLGDPGMVQLDAVKEQKQATQGLSQIFASNVKDRDREIYECYCELNLIGHEHKIDNKKTGLEIPYIVTIDKTSQKVLSIVRNYKEETEELPEALEVFVPYLFVPGFEFYGIGLLNILGNTTSAVTAAWRELLDAGMFASFPGFLYAKDAGIRQQTNTFRVAPGTGAGINTGGQDIGKVVMALPYKEPSQALMLLSDKIADTGARVGGTAEAQVGEGKRDAPVGTTIALIEQAQKILSSVHKRMHTAQARELQLIRDLFTDDPEAMWRGNKRPKQKWDKELFNRAVNDYDLVPQADPNTASHTQRIMKVVALKQMQSQSPELYNPRAVDTVALKTIGWSNPEQFFQTPAPAQPTPEQLAKLSDSKSKELMAQAKMEDAKTNLLDAQLDAANRKADRESKERIQLIDMMQTAAVHPEAADGTESIINSIVEKLREEGALPAGGNFDVNAPHTVLGE